MGFEQLREFAHSIGRTSVTALTNWRKASYRREETLIAASWMGH